MTVNDVRRLARHVGVDARDLFRTHLAFDYWNGGTSDADAWEVEDVVVVSPATVNCPPGTVMPFGAPMYGQNVCALLDGDDRCTVHAAKPTECRVTYSCDGNGRDKKLRRRIARAWHRPAARRFLAALNGGTEPTVPAVGLPDALEGMFWLLESMTERTGGVA